MSSLPKSNYTVQEFAAMEELADGKNEFYRGEVFAMSGGSPNHNTISLNIAIALRQKLRGSGCRPFHSDQRIRIPTNSLGTYPDVSVVCGPLETDAEDSLAITNPVAIFEVLSESTEGYDRGKKFDLYRDLESLTEYVLVSQYAALVERYRKSDDGSWVLSVFKGLDAVVELSSAPADLTLRNVYEDVEFKPEGDD
ncbi:MAG: Uma2 family endonuclease [Planctomycetota bacterium]|nr:Uma2 family endonuclease [Planctomycetota bacterium]